VSDSMIYSGVDGVRLLSGDKVRVAGFDFDDTLVAKHVDRVAFPSVVKELTRLHEEGFILVIFSNESLDHFKNPSAMQNTLLKKVKRLDKFSATVNLPLQMYVATRYDGYRKPSSADIAKKKPPGGNLMWLKMLDLNGLDAASVDMTESLFVGDAAGRPGEFSDADLAFARCVGVRFCHANDFFISKKIVSMTVKIIKETEESTTVSEVKTLDTEKPPKKVKTSE